MTEGFRVKAAYLGGHPDATQPSLGDLALVSERLEWTSTGGTAQRLGEQLSESLDRFSVVRSVKGATNSAKDRLLTLKEREGFVIDASKIESVQFKGDTDLAKAPSGYLAILPGVALGFGGKANHPLGAGGRLNKLLIVRYAEDGRDYEVFFANWPRGMVGALAQDASDKGGHELVSKIMAARAATPRTPEASVARSTDIAGRLRELTELREGGLITDSEFAAKRAGLLDKL